MREEAERRYKSCNKVDDDAARVCLKAMTKGRLEEEEKSKDATKFRCGNRGFFTNHNDDDDTWSFFTDDDNDTNLFPPQTGVPHYEDFISKAGKLHGHLK